MSKFFANTSITFDIAFNNDCVRISNMGQDHNLGPNGLYKKFDEKLYIHTDEDKDYVIKFQWDNGWHGCRGFKNGIVASDCFPSKRWAFISDLSKPVKKNVNIWTKEGDSSGFVSCGKP